MEQIITAFIEKMQAHISMGYLIVLIFASYGLRDFVADLVCMIRPTKKARSIAVLIIATVLAVVWKILFNTDLMMLFVTYAVGTSLYEIIIQAVIAKLKSKPEAPPFEKEINP